MSPGRRRTFVPKEGWVSSCIHLAASIHVVPPTRSSSFRPAGQAIPSRDRQRMAKDESIISHGAAPLELAGHSRPWPACSTISPVLAIDVSPTRSTLALVKRSMTQDQGAWVVDYRLRYTGQTGVIITPEELGVKVEGWVSNSRVASHALPRWSSLVISHGPDLSAISEVIAAVDESHRCRERLVVSVWTEDKARQVQAQSAAMGQGGRSRAGHGSSRARPSRQPSAA